jgi:CDP-paratose synthetase
MLTGATGFLGSYLARALITRGHELSIIKRRNSPLDRIVGLIPEKLSHDVENNPAKFIRDLHPDVLVNLATCYGRNGESLYELFRTNVLLPMRLLEAASTAKVPLFVNADTSLPPSINPYAMSKKHFSDWCRSVANSGIIHAINIRLESLYGPGDDQTKFTTQLITALLRNEPEFPMTLGAQCRDFIFVQDAADAFALLLEQGIKENNFSWIETDVGTGQITAIRTFAETACKIANSGTKLNFGAIPYRPGELMQTSANIRILKQLGWDGGRDLEAGLQATIAEERQRS